MPLPAKSITRWGTWISAVTFYSQNYDAIKSLILSLDDSAQSICICKELLENTNLRHDIEFTDGNFGCIPDTIKSLEAQGLKLLNSLCTYIQ